MASRSPCLLLLVLICCWAVPPARVSGDRYTAGTLRQYLREVITEALSTHCGGTGTQPPAYPQTAYPAAAYPVAAHSCPQCCRAPPPEECASGYVRCGGVCYQTLEAPLKHADAALACEAAGGRLAVPRSDHQHLCSRALALGAQVWLGITDPDRSGQFTGSDGAPVPRDGPYWDAGQPDNYTGEDPDGERCVVLFPDQGWHDRTCRHYARPLCQQS